MGVSAARFRPSEGESSSRLRRAALASSPSPSAERLVASAPIGVEFPSDWSCCCVGASSSASSSAASSSSLSS
eukprot:13696743-Alexandrium_andersonii.AAC.1